MKLTIRGYAPIVIPGELLKPMKGFESKTSYISKIASRWKSHSYLTNKLPSKLICLETVRDWARELGGYKSYADRLAGVGMSARIFGDGRRAALNDLDAGCAEVLQLNCPNALVTSYDLFSVKKPAPADLIFLDFNDYTAKRGMTTYREIVERTAQFTRKFLVLNDCTPFYFRYGSKSFATYSQFLNRKIVVVEDYFDAMRDFYRPLDLTLVGAAYFRDSSFLLLSKHPSPLILRKVTAPPVGMVTVSDGATLF